MRASCSPMQEAEYRTLCSSETLSSGRRGFFRDFSEHATRLAGDQWIAKVFGRLTSDEDRVRRIFADERVKDAVLGTLDRTDILYRGKDAVASRARRLEAFEAATAGELSKALLLASQAILRAPATGKCTAVDRGASLPLALLARAEFFLAADEPERALDDLRAIEETTAALPAAIEAELARTKERAERAVRPNGISVVPAASLPSPSSAALPLPSGGENPRLPGASVLLEIEETAAAGKRVIAAEEIAPGDALVAEPPLAAVLLPDFYGSHCHHCFARFRAPVGCPDCSGVAFCRKSCRDAAMASYHKHECKILALLIGSGMSVLSMLALRMVAQTGPTGCSRIWRRLHPSGESSGKDEPAPSSKSAKRRARKKKLRDSAQGGVDLRAYDLVAHEGKRSAKDFFQRTLMAAFLLRCLQRVGFFEERTRDEATPPGSPLPEQLSEEEIAVGALLLRHLQLLQFNAHEVFETRPGAKHRFRGSRPVYIGVAVYPTVSRFNHDCYPAVARYFIGRCIVIRATRALRRGDVVAENYGPIFTKRSLEERRRSLAGRYWFRCECTACRENWPRFEAMTNDDARLRCPTEGCPGLHRRPRGDVVAGPVECPSCGRNVDLRGPLGTLIRSEELYARGFAAMDAEEPEQASRTFFEAASAFHRVAVPPHRDTHLAEIAVTACMADYGNVWPRPASSMN